MTYKQTNEYLEHFKLLKKRAFEIIKMLFEHDPIKYDYWCKEQKVSFMEKKTNNDGVYLKIKSEAFESFGDTLFYELAFPFKWMHSDDVEIVQEINIKRKQRELEEWEQNQFANMKISDANEKHERMEYERLKKKYEE